MAFMRTLHLSLHIILRLVYCPYMTYCCIRDVYAIGKLAPLYPSAILVSLHIAMILLCLYWAFFFARSLVKRTPEPTEKDQRRAKCM